MMTNAMLACEAAFLTEVIKMHGAKVAKAYEAEEAAEVAFAEVFGFMPWEAPEHAPGWTAARKAREALLNENGYFWACSRLVDLERMVGSFKGEQLPLRAGNRLLTLRGEMPEAHASVAPWIAKTVCPEAWEAGKTANVWGSSFVMSETLGVAA